MNNAEAKMLRFVEVCVATLEDELGTPGEALHRCQEMALFYGEGAIAEAMQTLQDTVESLQHHAVVAGVSIPSMVTGLFTWLDYEIGGIGSFVSVADLRPSASLPAPLSIVNASVAGVQTPSTGDGVGTLSGSVSVENMYPVADPRLVWGASGREYEPLTGVAQFVVYREDEELSSRRHSSMSGFRYGGITIQATVRPTDPHGHRKTNLHGISVDITGSDGVRNWQAEPRGTEWTGGTATRTWGVEAPIRGARVRLGMTTTYQTGTFGGGVLVRDGRDVQEIRWRHPDGIDTWGSAHGVSIWSAPLGGARFEFTGRGSYSDSCTRRWYTSCAW